MFGKGSGLQIFFAVKQVVDTGNLRGLPRALTWGAELLEPPRSALNQPHRPDLELRGTPAHDGQRTLEELSDDPAKR